MTLHVMYVKCTKNRENVLEIVVFVTATSVNKLFISKAKDHHHGRKRTMKRKFAKLGERCCGIKHFFKDALSSKIVEASKSLKLYLQEGEDSFKMR